MDNNKMMNGKRILITGGSSGIGRATAITCAKAGAQVIVMGRNEEQLKKTVGMLEGENHLYYCVDLGSEDDLEPYFVDIVNKLQAKLDGMVYSAGISGVVPLKAIRRNKMFEVMNVNCFSFIEMVRIFSKKKFSNEGASIVGVSSAVVERGEQCQTLYSASKAAMDAAVKCMSFELVKRKIRINTVLPGMIRTEMMERVLASGSKEEVLGATSLLGIGKPEDVANSILFLLSDSSAHTTGRGIFVDGGSFL